MDDTQTLQALLDSGAPLVEVPHRNEGYLISKPLRIGSGQTLKLNPATVVRLAPKSDCPLIENRSYFDGKDHDITIDGGIWDMDNLRQSMNSNYDPAKVGKIPPTFQPDWFLGIATRFRNVDRFTLRNMTVRNPTTYGIHLSEISNFTVEDITFDYTTWNPIPVNMDGVHCDGGCHHGKIRNIRGTTYDDLVALNANDGCCSPKECPIHDIEVENLEAAYCHSAVRLLSAGADVSRITIKGIRGSFYTYAVGLTHYYEYKPRGYFEDIKISDVHVSKALAPEELRGWRDTLAIVDIEGNGYVKGLTIENIEREETTLPAATIRTDRRTIVDDLVVRGAKMVNRLDKPIRFLENRGLLVRPSFTDCTFEGAWVGTEPDRAHPVCAMYFATHFGNWYVHASEEELREYIGELASWGCRAISVWFDMHEYSGMDDPKAKKAVDMLHRILRAAKANGLKTDLTSLANEAFDTSPKELRADWTGGHNGYKPAGLESHYHREICPHKPGGMEYILKARREMLEAFKDVEIDSFTISPYDQGGCTCPACEPWGSNGYILAAEKVAALFREIVNPWGDVYLSTWNFGEHPAEWDGLVAQKDKLSTWVTMMDVAPQDLPRMEANPIIPFFCMSEISMNEMLPWGGCGANPLPRRFQKELSAFPHCGGLRPYSEGIYEDINKVMELAVLSGMAKDVKEAIGLYAERYFGAATAPLLQEAVFLMEENTGHWEDIYQGDAKANPYSFRIIDRAKPWTLGLKGTQLDPQRVRRVSELLDACEAKMTSEARASWRWRVLKIRGEIDQALLDGVPLKDMEPMFVELAKIYKVEPDTSVLLVPPSETLIRAADSLLFVPEPE